MNYLVFAFLWILYLALHSVLAADAVKAFFERILGKGYRYYRLVYSLLAIMGLSVLFIINGRLPSEVLFNIMGVVRYLSLIVAAFGILIIGRAFREYKFDAFIGLRDEIHEFRRTGILNHVRHPIYSGTILIVIGFFLFHPTIATAISAGSILVYLPIGIYFEEKKLIRQFGNQYLAYKKEVPSVFPRPGK